MAQVLDETIKNDSVEVETPTEEVPVEETAAETPETPAGESTEVVETKEETAAE